MSKRRPVPRHDVRLIFSENLRLLLRGGPRVAVLCRELGINRTQFNRFLSAEAHPRVDVLARIFSRFGVDARILTEPLEQGHPQMLSLPVPAPLHRLFLPEAGTAFDHFLLPDGFYLFWRRSFSQPGHVVRGLWYLRTEGAIKRARGFDLYPWPIRRGTRRFARKAPWEGVMLQNFDGICLYSRADPHQLMTYSFLEAGVQNGARSFGGFSVLGRRQVQGMTRVSPLCGEYLSGGRAEILRAARSCGLIPEAEAPPEVVRRLNDQRII